MTRVTFEANTLSAAIQKANAVAPPASANAFDKSAGIVLDIMPDDEVQCVIRSTNLDVFYVEVISAEEAEGEAVRWRLPSNLFSQLCASMASSSGKPIVMDEEPNSSRIRIVQGRTTSKIVPIDASYYPESPPFDDIRFTTVTGIGGRINQVAWAAGKPGNEPYSGIHFTGTHVMATDRYRIARATLLADLDRPVTVPVGVLGTVLRQSGDVSVGLDEHVMVFRPDEYTQITSSLLGMDYPPVDKVIKTDFDNQVTIKKTLLIERIKRAMGFAGANRNPRMSLYLGREEIAVMLSEDEVGLLGDVVEVPGQIDHKRIEICFGPSILVDALTNAPNDTVTIKYDMENNKLVYIDGGSGYESWVAPRAKVNAA